MELFLALVPFFPLQIDCQYIIEISDFPFRRERHKEENTYPIAFIYTRAGLQKMERYRHIALLQDGNCASNGCKTVLILR